MRNDEGALVRALDILKASKTLPDAHYRWRSIDHSGEPEPSGLNESPTCAFPDALGDLDVPGSPARRAYGRFLADNPGFFTLVQQRVVSYWACYHREEFPRLADYPGHRLVTAMRALTWPRTDSKHAAERGGFAPRRREPPQGSRRTYPVHVCDTRN
ncbi:hypothetical protein [Microbispora hainanensis]|uniref:Uncharacterized protein n=1 Tax=Microbispora hainanensis TaxID=568844 RepID=A0A544YT12_9ACTN|nr:hypothetical protein [Microbispora hainanensis]TQS19890.1 hypothetical protein FLX08_17740 [Microbispora hainanensis]